MNKRFVHAWVVLHLVACDVDTIDNMKRNPPPGPDSSEGQGAAGNDGSGNGDTHGSAGVGSVAGTKADDGGDAVSGGTEPECHGSGTEVCDGADNDCDTTIDEGCDCLGELTRDCGGIGDCRLGTQTCGDGSWSRCEDGNAETEDCDGSDNDCDGNVDEGCECRGEATRDCGGIGDCKLGKQTCTDGSWSSCKGGDAKPEECNDSDDDCDGNVDEGCECRKGAQRWCRAGEGVCASGRQDCEGGTWGACEADESATAELCDGLDNDCDGAIDDGFRLDVACDATGGCPQSRKCSEDGESSACSVDETLFDDERCDDVDNDCDGLVDVLVDSGSLRSVCQCEATSLTGGDADDESIAGNVDLCAETKCKGATRWLAIDATCYPLCRTESDPDGDGWGWEGGASCIVEDSPRALAASMCPLVAAEDFMSIGYCLDCSGTGEMPYAMCQTESLIDLRAFGRGERWLRVDYTYSAAGPAHAPTNLWFQTGAGRKHLPLVNLGDEPGRSQRLLRIEDACFTPSASFGSGCVGQGSPCAHCGDDEVCGAVTACGDYDLSQARLQVASEFCARESGMHTGAVTLHSVQLVQPNCD